MRKYWWRNKKWITRSKQAIKIKNMSDKHIKHCMKFLKDKGYISHHTLHTFLNTSFALQGDIAQLSFEQELFGIIESPVNFWIDAFELELAYRRRSGIIVYDCGMFLLRCERGIKVWIERILTRNIN